MTITINRLSAVLIASALSLASTHVLAQTPAKAPAKPAAAKKTGKDKLQTKEELRACMKLRESNLSRAAELEKKAEVNRQEKQKLMNAPDDVAASAKADVDAKLEAVKQADAAVKENAKAIADWNERSAEFEKNVKDMRMPDRQRQRLKDERFKLKAQDEALIAEREAKIKIYEASVGEANEKIAARAKVNEEWNKGNEALADEQDRLAESRDKWLAECANRRFIDTDEAEIKAEMKAGK